MQFKEIVKISENNNVLIFEDLYHVYYKKITRDKTEKIRVEVTKIK